MWGRTCVMISHTCPFWFRTYPTWKCKADISCSFCKLYPDTCAHLFWNCTYSQNLWKDIVALISNNCPSRFPSLYLSIDRWTDRLYVLYSCIWLFCCPFAVSTLQISHIVERKRIISSIFLLLWGGNFWILCLYFSFPLCPLFIGVYFKKNCCNCIRGKF